MKCKKLLNELFLYGITGIITVVVNILFYFLLYQKLGVPNVISTIIAWAVAVVVAFLSNKKFVFCNDSKASFKMIFSFFACRIVTGILEVVIMFLFVDVLSMSPMTVKLCSNIFVILANYFFSKFFVF